jgi:hypothetical protein
MEYGMDKASQNRIRTWSMGWGWQRTAGIGHGHGVWHEYG